MKKLILILFLLTIIPKIAYSEDTKIKCKTERTWLGVYWQSCPRDSVAIGARARVVGNFIYTDVECEKREVTCELVEAERASSDTEI